MKNQNQPPENPLLNILINIVLPAMVLNKGHHYLDSKWVLIVALSLPLIYGIQDYLRRKHKNYVSLLGLVNIALTGGLALWHLEGVWFAVKEASLPLVLGILVLGSMWTKKTAAELLFCNPQILNMELIEARISTFAKHNEFKDLLKRTTAWLSVSFFISAGMNFLLGLWIFKVIDPSLETAVREKILNEQIAEMTWKGFVVIALPLMVFSGTLIYFFLKRISQMIEEPFNSLLKT